MIKNIRIELLEGHPDNPRKVLGDLEELRDSIKANGVFQNLTVVPHPDKIGMYRVVIGHRRMAAAKLAGIPELPCSVVEMDYKDQVSTMLLENMQRSDLTVYEQAQGFQLMLDLGETLETIHQKTGFSPTTISRRVKLLELNQDKFAKAQERGATLEDYARLNKIENVKERNRVLEHIGTSNFEWELNNALTEQRAKKNKPIMLKELNSFATQIPNSANRKYEYSSYSSYSNYKEGQFASQKKSSKEYFYLVEKNGVTIYTLKEKTAKPKKSKKEKEADLLRDELRQLSKQAYEQRVNFIKNFTAFKSNSAAILKFLEKSVIYGIYTYGSANSKLFESLVPGKYRYEDTAEIYRVCDTEPERVALIIAYCKTGDDESYVTYYSSFGEKKPSYRKNLRLIFIYEQLNLLGYQISDVEKQLLDGTHPIFTENKN